MAENGSVAEEVAAVVEQTEAPEVVENGTESLKRKFEDPAPTEVEAVPAETAPETEVKEDEQPAQDVDESAVPSESATPNLSTFEEAKQKAAELAAKFAGESAAKRPKTDEEEGEPVTEAPPGSEGSGQQGADVQSPGPYYNQQSSSQTHRIEVPNSKVGLVIGKSGETIKYLQQQSGARIQVTRDADTDPHAPHRPIELMGTPDQISRAEQLIQEVIAEAQAGGSGALVARGFGGLGPPGDQLQIRVPNNKVGLIIGRGGETIKNLQNRSGARIQVQSDKDTEPGATERVVTLIGSKRQTEAAEQLIKEVTDENRPRGPPFQQGGGGGGGGGYGSGGGYRGGPQYGSGPPPSGPPMQQSYYQAAPYPPPQYGAPQPHYSQQAYAQPAAAYGQTTQQPQQQQYAGYSYAQPQGTDQTAYAQQGYAQQGYAQQGYGASADGSAAAAGSGYDYSGSAAPSAAAPQ
eukprot:jgi/Mesen1/3744/ME000204S03008